MLFELYENITKDDLKNIIFLLKLPNKYKENKNFLDILCYLEKQEIISKNKLDVLENVLLNVARELTRTINIYKKECQRTMLTSLPSEDEFEDLVKPSLPVQVVTTAVSSTEMEYPTDDTGMQSIGELVHEVSGQANEEDLKGGNTENYMSALSLNEQPTIEMYAMNRKHRGYCLIINNSEFMKSDRRRGTEKDEESLKSVFSWLELEVELHKELTTQQIHNCMQDFQARDHTERDCFVCCILTHGQSRAVFGTDNGIIDIENIISYFSSCKSLAGKPKLFFIQACQGKNSQKAHDIEADATASSDDKKSAPSIPNHADFLVGMSTVDGYYSFRHTQRGSWYIQTLCKNLTKMVPKGEDILSILTKVNRDVSEMEHSNDKGTKMKQMPQPAYTLRKKLVFPKPLTPYKATSQTTY
ncbi:caspase-8-like isoform X2 [Mixophyes fleayi]